MNKTDNQFYFIFKNIKLTKLFSCFKRQPLHHLDHVCPWVDLDFLVVHSLRQHIVGLVIRWWTIFGWLLLLLVLLARFIDGNFYGHVLKFKNAFKIKDMLVWIVSYVRHGLRHYNMVCHRNWDPLWKALIIMVFS